MATLIKLTPPSTAVVVDEPLNVRYNLTVEGVQLGSFVSLSGGDVEVAVIEHPVVFPSGEYSTLKIPGPISFSPITLSRGFGNSIALYNWFVTAAMGHVKEARKNGSITLNGFVDGVFKPLVQWDLENMWPTRLSGFEGDQSSQAGVAMLSITIVAESIERKDVTI